MKKIHIISFFLCAFVYGFSQDSATEKNKPELNGYIKTMQSLHFDNKFIHLVSGNLVHNRINVKWKPTGKIHAAAEVRNRVFWGEETKANTNFADGLKNENELANLSVLWMNKDNFVFHTNVERLWVGYKREKWNLRVGRQRINWGIATTWNPCDIFNTYNFLDFDYEERPGSDAVKFQYFFKGLSHLEVVASPSGKKNRTIAAARFFMNRAGYDFQIISGLYQDRLTAGFGWAGSIGGTGFKGEGVFYLNKRDSGTGLNFTMEFDHLFNGGWYLNTAMLHNQSGRNKPVNEWSEVELKFSPLNLMPAKWNMIFSSSKEFTPLFNARMSIVYSPGINLVILLPSIQYNLAANLDASLVWQSFFVESEERLRGFKHSAFIRLKWSF